MNRNPYPTQHAAAREVKPVIERGPKPKRVRPLKRRLHEAGVTYDDVARLTGVTWRMVKFVIDGQRTSAPVMAAIERLAPKGAA